MNREPLRLAVLGSGEGTNFEALADAVGDYEIVVVGSDRPAAPILARARKRGLATFCLPPGDYPDRSVHDRTLAETLSEHRTDCIALAGYMRLVGPAVLAAWEGRLLNIHPALLPAFPGLRTHERALAAGAREHGATVHFVTADLDAGPGIVQAKLQTEPGENAAALARRVRVLEHRIYPIAVHWYAQGRVRMKDGAAWLDGRPLAGPVLFEE